MFEEAWYWRQIYFRWEKGFNDCSESQERSYRLISSVTTVRESLSKTSSDVFWQFTVFIYSFWIWVVIFFNSNHQNDKPQFISSYHVITTWLELSNHLTRKSCGCWILLNCWLCVLSERLVDLVDSSGWCQSFCGINGIIPFLYIIKFSYCISYAAYDMQYNLN